MGFLRLRHLPIDYPRGFQTLHRRPNREPWSLILRQHRQPPFATPLRRPLRHCLPHMLYRRYLQRRRPPGTAPQRRPLRHRQT